MGSEVSLSPELTVRRSGGIFTENVERSSSVVREPFKAREIASQVELDEGAVSTALSRLKERGLVDHKATYWAVTTDDSRLESYGGYDRATALFNERLGEEETDAWRGHAPDEHHPSVDDER